MSIIITNIQNACEKLGKMNKQQIINQLNDQGLNYYCKSVRRRRLFKTAYRMIRYKNFETNTNNKGLEIIYKAIVNIGDNIVTPEMSYFPPVENTIVNELRDVETEVYWKEDRHLYIKDVEVVTHTTTERKTFINHEKKKHINEVKASQGKNKREISRLMNQLNENKWKYEFLQEHNYIPELAALANTEKFVQGIELAISNFAPEFIKQKVAPWATPPIREKLPLFRGPYFDNPWGDLRDMLVNRKSYDDEVAAINSRFKVKQFDPEIMAEPDQFERVTEKEHYGTVPHYAYQQFTHKGTIIEKKVFNHLGLRATPEAFENVAQEIYKISDMPGFHELKLHWSGMRERKHKYMMKLNEVKGRIDETIESYHSIKKLRGKKNMMKRKKWLKKMSLEKKRLIGFGYYELKEFREICKEFEDLNKRDEEMTKERAILQIKDDLIRIAEAAPKVGNVYMFTRYENLVGKTKIPAFALKRYQSILRAMVIKGDIYDSLRYHFKKRREYMKKSSRNRSSFDPDAFHSEDY